MLDEPLGECLGQCGDGELLLLVETERTARKTYRTRDKAEANMFDFIERF